MLARKGVWSKESIQGRSGEVDITEEYSCTTNTQIIQITVLFNESVALILEKGGCHSVYAHLCRCTHANSSEFFTHDLLIFTAFSLGGEFFQCIDLCSASGLRGLPNYMHLLRHQVVEYNAYCHIEPPTVT